jgi:RNA polymerase sporulation-specific sigma factor
MKEFQDNELISLVNEKNEDASNLLYEKYSYIVDIIVNKYKKGAYYFSIDINELRQEALVGFSDALVSYNQDNDASLKTFITLCVERRVRNFIRRSDTIKDKMLREAYSLDTPISEEGGSLVDAIPSNNLSNPEERMVEEESIKELKEQIDDLLSPLEKDVFELMVNDFNEDNISEILNISLKQVYNCVSRIRMKLKDVNV